MIKEISFNKRVGELVGVEKAVIIHYLAFCIEKNKSNNLEYYDGSYWTNNTHESLIKVLTFFKSRLQLTRRLNSLIEDEYLIKSDKYVRNKNEGHHYCFSKKLNLLYENKVENFIFQENKKTSEDLSQVIEVLNHFNNVRKKMGARGYRTDKISQSHKSFILSRLKEGADVKEMKSVIDLKEKEWLSDNVMQKYLRIETLFNKSKYGMYALELPLSKSNSTSEIQSIKRKLNIKFGMRGIKNDESDSLAKKLIELGYDNMEYLNSYLIEKN